jgi:hypothetical protein
MRPKMFVEISNKRMNIKIECEVRDKFSFPFINEDGSHKGYIWFNMGETHERAAGGGLYLFSITHDNKKLVFHSDWTHEFTSEGVLIDIVGSGNRYLVNFGFIND